MSFQRTFQELVEELQLLNARISLKLPASSESLGRQVVRIGQAQQQLELLKEDMINWGRGNTLMSREAYRVLLGMIDRTICEADSYKFLAEEFPIDPEGTIACLQQMKRKSPGFVNAKLGLETVGMLPQRYLGTWI